MRKAAIVMAMLIIVSALASCGMRITIGDMPETEPDYGDGIENLVVLSGTVDEIRRPAQQESDRLSAPAYSEPPVLSPTETGPVTQGEPTLVTEPTAPPEPTLVTEPIAPPEPTVVTEPIAPPEPTVETEPTVVSEPTIQIEPTVETQAPTEPEPTGKPEPSPEERRAIAEGLIGASVSKLYAAVGTPNYSDYAPSCLVDGEDGMLYYDGFTVYTEKTTEAEVIVYVE